MMRELKRCNSKVWSRLFDDRIELAPSRCQEGGTRASRIPYWKM